ncbi:MAG TPA: hypothetical protein VF147_16430 [Vicinamibacterales bacterium]
MWLWFQPPPKAALAPDWEALTFVLAGDGQPGSQDGIYARFSDPFGVAAATDGSVVIGDAGASQAIRRIAADGTVTTLAGGKTGFTDGIGRAARFRWPSAVAIGVDGTIYVADTGNNAVRALAPSGMVSTLAGDGTAGYLDGPAAQARFNGPVGVTVAPGGRIIVADSYNDRIRAIEPDGRVVTIAGDGSMGAVDGVAAEARFNTPCGVAAGPDGTIYVADTGNDAVRAIATTGEVTTVGPLPWDGLRRPVGIAVDQSTRHIFVTDDRGRIVQIAPGASSRIVAGAGPGFADGGASEARFRSPSGIAVAAPGRLIVTDRRNALVRLVGARTELPLRPPASPSIHPAFDFDAFTLAPFPWPFVPREGPFEITGTFGEPRGSNAERLHAGLDVHSPEGTPVLAVRDGVVSDPVATADFGSITEWVRIGPLTYIHLRVGRLRDSRVFGDERFVPSYGEGGALMGMRVKRGSAFTAGDAVGTLNGFNHVHLNMGWPGEERNPLQMRFPQYRDTVAPRVASVRLADEQWAPLTRRVGGRVAVTGRVRVIVDAWDQVNGNSRRRRLGLYRVGYEVLRADGSTVAGVGAPGALTFDRMPLTEKASASVFAPGSGVAVYSGAPTRYLYVATSTLRDGDAREGLLDTSLLPPGNYVVRAVVADFSGNEGSRDLPIVVEP